MRLTILTFITLFSIFSTATPWNHDLWLGCGGIWESRCKITVQNQSDAVYTGKNITIQVGSKQGEIPLAGAEAAAIRVVNAQNRQLLYSIRTPELSDIIVRGPIPKGATLVAPLVCDAHKSTSLTVYYDNGAAWPLAESLSYQPPVPLNGDFETGDKHPLGWKENQNLPKHKLSLSTESPFSGERCIKQVADPGLELSWSGYTHSGIEIISGANYTVTVRVRTKDLKGDAGWFVHVGDRANSMMLNKSAVTKSAVSEWQELIIKFKAPETANQMRMGSLLRGSGTAWFDDLRIESDQPENQPALSIVCAEPEQLKLKREGADAQWIETPEGIKNWHFRFPLNILNSPGAPQNKDMLAVVGIDSVTRGLLNPVFRLTMHGKEVETIQLAETLLFKVDSQPGTIQTFYLYVANDSTKTSKSVAFSSTLGSDIPSDQLVVTKSKEVDRESWKKLLHSNLNLIKNPDFEEGDSLPSSWTTSSENKAIHYSKAGKGLFGDFCAETIVPATEGGNWYGWRQTIAVTPGSTYFFGGWMSTENCKASGQLHAHIHPQKGSTATTKFLSAGHNISGTTGWTPMCSSVTIPYDYNTFSLHLTANTTGTMRHDGFFMAECLSCAIGEPQTVPQKKGLILWPANPIVKVFKETLPTDKRELSIHMARNESEPLQLALRSGRDYNNLEIRVSPPVLHSGTIFGRFFSTLFAPKTLKTIDKITIGRVDYVPIDTKSSYSNFNTPEWEFKFPSQQNGSDGWAGWWPDPIVETNRFSLSANQTQPLWITFDTDAQTEPGQYRGVVQIIENGKTLLERGYTVNVWDFEIPLRPEFPAIYDIRFKNIEFSNWDSTQEAYEEVLRFMAKKKLSPDTACRQIPLERAADGSITCDFTEHDKVCKRYFDELQFKVSYMPQNFYSFGWAHPPRKFLGEQPYKGLYPFKNVDRTELRSEYKLVFQQALKLYWEHLKAMGWADNFVLYISDEPHFSDKNIVTQMRALCAMIHEVDPAIRIYCSTWQHCEEWNNSIDVWGVGHYGCFSIDEMRNQKKLNNELWFTTDGQMCTDTPLLATERMLPHYAFKYGADAYEFWGVSWYTYNPWKFGWHSYISQSSTPGDYYYVRYPNGDGFLLYPPIPELGTSKEPVTSIRLEAARDGVEDWCYLKKLKTLAVKQGDQKALAVMDEFLSFSTIPNAGGRYAGRNLSDPDRLLQLRVEMGAAIECLANQ